MNIVNTADRCRGLGGWQSMKSTPLAAERQARLEASRIAGANEIAGDQVDLGPG